MHLYIFNAKLLNQLIKSACLACFRLARQEREVQCLRREVKALTLRVKELEDQLFIERSKGAVPIAGEFRKACFSRYIRLITRMLMVFTHAHMQRPAPTLVEMLHGHIDDVQSMLEELRGLVEK